MEYDPLSLELICTKADLYRYQEDYVNALIFYQIAYELDASYTRSMEGITICNAYLNNQDRAYEYLELYNIQESSHYWKHRLAGEVASHFNDQITLEQSIQNLEKYAKNHPEADLSGDLMSVYAKTNPDLAMQHLKKAYENGIGLVSLIRYPAIKPLKKRADYQHLIQNLRLDLTPSELNKSRTKILHIKSELNHSLTVQQALLVYAKADGNYTRVYYQAKGKIKSELLRLKISALDIQLSGKGFLRVHNSYLVNMEQANIKLEGNTHKAWLCLKKFDVLIPISRKKYTDLRSYLSNSNKIIQ